MSVVVDQIDSRFAKRMSSIGRSISLVMFAIMVMCGTVTKASSSFEPNNIELETSNVVEQNDVPKVITGTVNVTAYVGETATLPCEVINLGNHHVNWLKIDQNVPITLTVGYHQFSRNMRFRVARVHHNNRNQMSHHHANHHGKHPQQHHSHDSVAVPAAAHEATNEENVVEKDVSASTTSSTVSPARIESWNFEIRKVSPEDQGLYECYIKVSPRHKTKANIYLTVKSEKEKGTNGKAGNFPYYSNSFLLDNPRSERLSSGSVERIDLPPNNWVKLRCNATGVISLTGRNVNHPTYDLQWYKDDNLIEQDSRRLKKWVSSYDDSNYMELDLYAVEPEDSGLYQCRRDKTILKNVLLNVLENGAESIKTARLCGLIALMLAFNLVASSFLNK